MGTADNRVAGAVEARASQPRAASTVSPYYPLFIDLHDQPVVVVGAGAVAERKVNTLLEHGARVTVIATEATPAIQELAQQGRLTWHERAYEPGDLTGALLAIAATSSRAVNEAVYSEAAARPMLVNVVDVPDLCNAIVPSIMERGNLEIAVSTCGASPETAQSIRHGLEDRFPAWWADYMKVVGEVRTLVKQRVHGPASARSPLYRAVLESDLRDRIAAGERPDAEDVYRRTVAPLIAKAIPEDKSNVENGRAAEVPSSTRGTEAAR